MLDWGSWAFRAVAFLIPVLLCFAAFPRLSTGLIVDGVFPVPTYMATNVALPRHTYVATARRLARATSNDGKTQISRAEAAILAGESPEDTMLALEHALTKAPASARGWTLLSEQRLARDPERAGQALAIAMAIAPRDYWLAGRRAQRAAQLWDYLTEEARESAKRQVRLLWTEPAFRRQLTDLLTTEVGAMLVTRAFAADPDELRAVNRWVAEQRRRARQRL